MSTNTQLISIKLAKVTQNTEMELLLEINETIAAQGGVEEKTGTVTVQEVHCKNVRVISTLSWLPQLHLFRGFYSSPHNECFHISNQNSTTN